MQYVQYGVTRARNNGVFSAIKGLAGGGSETHTGSDLIKTTVVLLYNPRL